MEALDRDDEELELPEQLENKSQFDEKKDDDE
jgi:hypothetical protein